MIAWNKVTFGFGQTGDLGWLALRCCPATTSSRIPGWHSRADCSHKYGENKRWILSLFLQHILSLMLYHCRVFRVFFRLPVSRAILDLNLLRLPPVPAPSRVFFCYSTFFPFFPIIICLHQFSPNSPWFTCVYLFWPVCSVLICFDPCWPVLTSFDQFSPVFTCFTCF